MDYVGRVRCRACSSSEVLHKGGLVACLLCKDVSGKDTGDIEDPYYDGLEDACEAVAAFYESILWSNSKEGALGRRYLESRGYSEEVSRRFRFGFAPDGWDALVHKSLEWDNQEYLVDLGLLVDRQDRRYDFLRNRIILPISDVSGRVIAFNGRNLSKEKTKWKYLHSKEVPGFFEKKRVIYGMDSAVRRGGDTLFLVEGALDAVGPIQAGYEGFAATLGTSFSRHQARLVRRYFDRVALLFDGDDAGRIATEKAVEVCRGLEGLEVLPLRCPPGTDPDTMSKDGTLGEVLREALR